MVATRTCSGVDHGGHDAYVFSTRFMQQLVTLPCYLFTAAAALRGWNYFLQFFTDKDRYVIYCFLTSYVVDRCDDVMIVMTEIKNQ